MEAIPSFEIEQCLSSYQARYPPFSYKKDELFEALFPQAAKSRSRARSRVPDSAIVYVQRSEINSLLAAAKAPYGAHLVQHHLVAFDNIISILTKIPWLKLQGVTTSQRDHMFELCKRNILFSFLLSSRSGNPFFKESSTCKICCAAIPKRSRSIDRLRNVLPR